MAMNEWYTFLNSASFSAETDTKLSQVRRSRAAFISFANTSRFISISFRSRRSFPKSGANCSLSARRDVVYNLFRSSQLPQVLESMPYPLPSF